MRQDSAFSISNCNAHGCSNPYSHLSVSSIRPPSIPLHDRNTPSSTPQRNSPSAHCPNNSPFATCFESWNAPQAIPYIPMYGTAHPGRNAASFLYQSAGGRLFEHFLHHFAVGSAAHGVGDNFAVEQVQYRREVQFAVLSFEFGHVGQPFFVGLFGCE